ncbi:50S ribosomal protein L3 [Candidatus Roizmanbacteria bacterium]|nr:50S ribosomal protein L3 [Candidatus Roizmanbacteria bacterium]
MFGFLLAQKGEQSQKFNEKGKRIPTTFLKTSPCYLVDVHSSEKRGYAAVKLGMGTKRNIKEPLRGELKKAGIEASLRFLKEKKLQNEASYTFLQDEKVGIAQGENTLYVGTELKPEQVFKVGDMVDVAGISKGKGFQGVVKRHGFAGGPKTHGQSDRLRAPGSMGQSTTPGRTYKGKRMAGRMGGERVTVKNLEIVTITEDGLYVKGLVPGVKNCLIEITQHT